MIEHSLKKALFGGEIEMVILGAEASQAELILNQAYKEGLRLQRIFNFYDEKSELSRLNKKRRIKASKELLEVVKKSLEYCKATNGSYDISLGKIFLARKKGEKEPIVKGSYEDIKIKNKEIILNHEDVLVDLGSSAKGYIVDKMINILKDEGVESGLIDGRGDISAFGKPFRIRIQHPRSKDKDLGEIQLQNEAVATSGDYKQYKKSYEKSHIINNQTISVTVISKDLFTADLLATAVMTNIDNTSINLIKRSKSEVLIVDKKMNIKYINGFEDRL